MVTVVLAGVPSAAPVGAERFRVKVSSGSSLRLARMRTEGAGTTIGPMAMLSVETPAGNCSTPEVIM
jgi:hypothetical protein